MVTNDWFDEICAEDYMKILVMAVAKEPLNKLVPKNRRLTKSESLGDCANQKNQKGIYLVFKVWK